MFYDLAKNKLYESLEEFQYRQYQFVKDGCVVNINKIKSMIEKGELKIQRPIIAKRKNILTTRDQDSFKYIKKLEDSLEDEDREQFQHNKSIIFEQRRKFKYVSVKQQDEGLSNERKDFIESQFLAGNKIAQDLGEGEQLQYLIKNWREVFRKLTIKHL